LPGEIQQATTRSIVRLAARALPLFLLFSHLLVTPVFSQYHFLGNGEPLSHGSDSGFLLDTPTRIKIDLAGLWDVSVGTSAPVPVPVPGVYDFRGTALYQRGIKLSKEQIDRYRFHLVMIGVDNAAEATINGEFVASHAGGGTSLVEPIAPLLLQPGSDNVLRIAVSNELDGKSTLPLRPAVWGMRNYGGISREIYLLGTPLAYIKDAAIRPEVSENGQSARISVRATVDGPDSTGVNGFTCELLDKISGETVAHTPVVPLRRKGSEWEEVTAELALALPKLWSPESPDLYLVRCLLVRTAGKEYRVVDQYDVATGIRSVGTAGPHLVLNGKRLILRGVIWYEDHPVFGSALTYEQREKDIVQIKNLGANVVRFIGRPPHPYMLNLCDRYGLLAMEELSVVRVPGPILGSEAYNDLAVGMLRSMIVRDRNHPSVMAWGLGDEFEASHPDARAFVSGLGRIARAMDNRPLYFGAVAGSEGCTDLVDIAAVTVHAADVKAFRTQVEEWRAAHRKQPVVVAKFGSEVQQANKNGYSDPLSQEAQARFYLQRFDVLKALDYDGGIVWSFNDWRGDRPALTVHTGDPTLHGMGLVSMTREKRLAYDAVRAVFHGEKFVALPIGTHSAGVPIVFVLAGFVVLVGMAYIYNASRRFRESLNRSVLNSYNFFADVRDQRIVSLGHSTLIGAVISVSVAIVVASILFRFRDNLLLDNILSYLLIGDMPKKVAIALIWNPLLCIGAGAGILFAGLLLLSGIVHFLRVFVRARIFPFHAYTIVMWSTSPLLILVPVGMILYRVMENNAYIIPVFVLCGGLAFWVYLRLLKGVSIILDVRPAKIFMLGLFAVVAAAGMMYAYYDYTQAVPMHIAYLLSTLVHLQ
jgi:hypothetical protein